MPKRFLTKIDRDNLNNFPKEISYDDMVKYFTINHFDMKQIPIQSSSYNKLGFAIQLCSLRYMGFIPKDLTSLPKHVLHYLSQQLNIDPNCVGDYGNREKTVRKHQSIIANYFGFNKPDEGYESELLKWITDRAMEHNKPSLLLHSVLDKLFTDKIIRPGITVLEELISVGRNNSNKITYGLLSHILTDEIKAFLEDILISKNEEGNYIFSWLKGRANSNTPENLIECVKKLDYLKKYDVDNWDLTALNPNRVKFLSHIAKRTNIVSIRRFKNSRKYPVLISFLYQTFVEILDEMIDIFNACVEKTFNNAKKDYNKFKSQNTKRTEKEIKLFKKIGSLILDEVIEDINLRKEIYNTVPKDELEKAIKDCDEIIRSDNSQYFLFLKNKYSYIRKFSPTFLKSIIFNSSKSFSPLLEAIEILNTLNNTNRRKIPDDAPINFISKKALNQIINKEGNIDKALYELSALKELKDGLKSGNVYVDKSRHYADLSTYLITNDKWTSLEKDVCKQINLPLEGEKRLNALIEDTIKRYKSVDRLLDKSDKLRLEKGKIVISPLEAEKKSESLIGLEKLIDNRLPQIDLTDLLIEVDSWINYSKCFEHADYTETNPDLKYLYASLIGLGSNLGLTRMSQISSLSYNKLSYLSNWYIREETLKKAIDNTVNYYYHIPLSRFWGKGSFSSSDGYDVKTSGKIRNAGYLSRKFGPKKGIFFYSWTGDLYLQYGSKVISANVRDATYVLDGILNNETELPIVEHTTDTQGYTYIVFALFDLLGLSFSPRIRDLKDQNLFRVDNKNYKNLEHRMKDKINTKLILQHWNELKRVAGSLKLGWVTASLYISKLQSYPRKNIMTKVLQEYGKLVRTNFILRYMEDEEFRRRIQAQLNKGEAVNGLRDFLLFANEKTIRKRQLEEQMVQASCLTLLSNLVMTWNTVYMSKIIQELIDEGYPVKENDLSRFSPARYEHVNPYGKFYFNVEKELNRKGLRPLRNYNP